MKRVMTTPVVCPLPGRHEAGIAALRFWRKAQTSDKLPDGATAIRPLLTHSCHWSTTSCVGWHTTTGSGSVRIIRCKVLRSYTKATCGWSMLQLNFRNRQHQGLLGHDSFEETGATLLENKA